MATKATSSFKTKIHYGNQDGPPETFTPINELLDITRSGMKQNIEDGTSMDSPNGWSESIATIRDGGTVTTQVNAVQDDSTQNALLGFFNAGATRNYRIVYASGTKRISFAAIITDFSEAYPLKGKMVNDITFQITGQPVKEAHP